MLGKVIPTLPEGERTILALYYIEGFTLREVGETLGVSDAHISKILGRTLLKLRRTLNATPPANTPEQIRSAAGRRGIKQRGGNRWSFRPSFLSSCPTPLTPSGTGSAGRCARCWPPPSVRLHSGAVHSTAHSAGAKLATRQDAGGIEAGCAGSRRSGPCR